MLEVMPEHDVLPKRLTWADVSWPAAASEKRDRHAAEKAPTTLAESEATHGPWKPSQAEREAPSDESKPEQLWPGSAASWTDSTPLHAELGTRETFVEDREAKQETSTSPIVCAVKEDQFGQVVPPEAKAKKSNKKQK